MLRSTSTRRATSSSARTGASFDLAPRAAFVGALVALLAACDGPQIRFSDSVDLTLDFRASRESTLHTPYVEGARVHVRAHDAADDAMSLSGYSLASSDPEVLAVDPDADDASATARAVGPGIAELWLLDPEGDVVASAEIEVRAPTRAVLHAAAPLFLRRDDVPTEAFDPTVVTGGLATFAVSYYDGATPLHGAGALGVVGSEGIDASTSALHLDEARDWLRVTPRVDGLHALELTAAGKGFAQVQIEAVAAEAIADVELRGQNERRARRDDELVVIAQAYDDEGERVFGAAFDWELAGARAGETSDLFRYADPPDAGMPIAVSFGELRSEATIHADAGDIDGDGELSCSVNGRAQGTSALGLLVLAAFRRRPRRHPPHARA